MSRRFSGSEVRELVKEYHNVVDWDDRHQKDERTRKAVTALAKAIVEEYDEWAGTDELTTLYQLCQTSSVSLPETKRQRVAELQLSESAVETVTQYIDETIGIVGGGKGQIKIPTKYESEAYQLLETLVTEDALETLDEAIKEFAELDISGIQAGVLSPILYFLHPDKYPVINKASRDGMEAIGGYEISSQLDAYPREARKYREFRDEYDLGRPDGNLRDLDWFFYRFNDGDLKLSKPTVWIEKTQIHGEWKEPEETELSLGRALISPQESTDGKDIYWQLREADVGDIVVHLLQDEYTFAGASIVDSELITEYEFPEYIEQRWDPSQRDEGGYLRRLREFTEFDDPLELDTELFDHPAYMETLDKIRDEYSGLFYTKNRALTQGGYLTKCPEELAVVLADASDELRAYFEDHRLALDEYEGGRDGGAGNGSSDDHTTTYYLWNTNLDHGTDGRQAFKRGVAAAYGDETYATKVAKPAVGDILLAYQNGTGVIGVGEVTEEMGLEPIDRSDPDIDPITSEGLEYHRNVDWIYTLPDSAAISAADAAKLLNRGNMSRVATTEAPTDQDGAKALYNEVRSRFKELHASEPSAAHQHRDIKRILEKKRQAVFYGPPGTGKTYTARRFAEWYRADADSNAAGTAQIRTVTFHPSFSYEDFIEGFTATVEDGGQVAYDYEQGSFAEIVEDARAAYETSESADAAPPFFLIIDEINRGNLAQIFGETITLLEADKRLDQPNETTAQLAHSGDPFVIPPNLYVIGTMNTADESIALVDTALRRRFRFLQFPPQMDTVAATYPDVLDSTDLRRTLETGDPMAQLLSASLLAIDALNDRIITLQHLGKRKQIGHTYLFDLQNPQEVVDTWRFEILPQLEEYYFGQFDAMERELFSSVTHPVFDADTQQIMDFDAKRLYHALCDLIELAESDRPAYASSTTGKIRTDDETDT